MGSMTRDLRQAENGRGQPSKSNNNQGGARSEITSKKRGGKVGRARASENEVNEGEGALE